MPDDANQPADTPKRPRTARSSRRTGRKRTVQVTPSPTPELEAAAPLIAQKKTGSMAPQSIPMPEASAQPAPEELPIGERWGEFPSAGRQAELARQLQAWNQERNHKGRPGPFADFFLTGADVYWLAAQIAGKGDVAAGKAQLAFRLGIFPSSLHLEGANLTEIHLEGANLGGAWLEGADLSKAHLQGAFLSGAQLQEVSLSGADLQDADLSGAQLQDVHLLGAQLQRANLSWTHLAYGYFIDIATIGKPPKMSPEVSKADDLLDNELGS